MSFLFAKPKIPEIRMPAMPALPATPPTTGTLLTEEKKKIRKGATRGTILTGPRGILEPADTYRKTLLGE